MPYQWLLAILFVNSLLFYAKAEEDPVLSYGAIVGPVFEGAALVPDINDYIHRLGIKYDRIMELRKDPYTGAHILQRTKEVMRSTPFSAFVRTKVKYRSEDVESLREAFYRHPDLYAKPELCKSWYFNALDEFVLQEGGKFVGMTETGVCLSDYNTNQTSFMGFCLPQFRANMYRVVSIAQMSQSNQLVLFLFDEAGLCIPSKVPEAQNSSCLEGAGLIGRPFTLGLYTMDERNKELGYTKDILIPDRHTHDWVTHFNHSMIESITYYRDNLYFTRGFRLLGDAKLIQGYGERYTMYLPQRLFELGQEEYSIQAMELYEFKERIYFHAAGVSFVDRKTEQKPFYWRCVTSVHQSKGELIIPNKKTNATVEGPNGKCIPSTLNEYITPVDFVFYNGTGCKKLLAFYQYAMRAFDPTADIAEVGIDYRAYPFLIVEWMNFHLKAVMFHNERFYFFTTANRLLIETTERRNDCSELLKDPNVLEEQYASEFILKSIAALRHSGSTGYASLTKVKYQFDPHRIGKRSGTVTIPKSGQFNVTDFIWNPPLEYRREIPKSYLLATPVEDQLKTRSVALTVVYLIILILLIFGMGCIIYYFCSVSDKALQEPRRPKFLPGGNPTQVILASPVSMVKTTRSALATQINAQAQPEPLVFSKEKSKSGRKSSSDKNKPKDKQKAATARKQKSERQKGGNIEGEKEKSTRRVDLPEKIPANL